MKENSAPNALDDDKTKDAVVLDVTFVDDEAIAVLASVPATLTQKLSLKVEVEVEAEVRLRLRLKLRWG